MLHVTCDVIDIAQCHFFKSKMAAMYFALYQNLKLFFSQFVLENVRNRTKTVLVTLIAFSTRNFSKMVILLFTS